MNKRTEETMRLGKGCTSFSDDNDSPTLEKALFSFLLFEEECFATELSLL